MKATIHFDGGTKPTNPGRGYGSFQIVLQTLTHKGRWQAPSDMLITSNEAEYITFWMAIMEAKIKFPAIHHMVFHSDSNLLVEQMRGNFKCRNPRLSNWRERCRKELLNIGYDIFWNSRTVSVELFGH